MRIRGHNLLCIQGYVGKGYSPEFVAEMTRVVESLGDEVVVTVIDRPDVLCDACPNLAATGCTLHGEGSERSIVSQDQDVMHRLGIDPGARHAWSDILKRIRQNIRPGDLDGICGGCPWLSLGHCKEGLRH